MSDHMDPGGFDDHPGSPDDLDWIEDLVGEWDGDAVDDADAFGPDAFDPDTFDPVGDDDSETTEPASTADRPGPSDTVSLDVEADAHHDPAIVEPDLAALGATTSDVLHDALTAVGADDAASVIGALDVDHIDPRTAVAALDSAGLGARVEHSDIGAIVEAVADGRDVVLTGPGGGARIVTGVDIAADSVALQATDGRSSTVSLRDLADAWSQIDQELLVLSPTSTGPVSLGGDTLILAVDADALVPPIAARAASGGA